MDTTNYDYYRDELNIMARRWEEQAEACRTVRCSSLGDDTEETALLNRGKVFEKCSKEIRSLAARIEESSQIAKKLINDGIKHKLPKATKKAAG
jgi:hypothetical protein